MHLNVFRCIDTTSYMIYICICTNILLGNACVWVSLHDIIIVIIIIISNIIIKKGWQCKAVRERLAIYQSEDSSPTLPTHRIKEEKRKSVEDKKGASSYSNKEALTLLLKPASPAPSNTGSPRLFHRDTGREIKILRYYYYGITAIKVESSA